MERRARFLLLGLLVVATASCGDSDPASPDEQADELNVTGTWTGTLLLDITGEGLGGGEISFHLTQNASAVTGTQTHPDPNDPDTGTVSGSIAGNTLTLEWRTNDTHADCTVFNVSMVFAVSSAALDMTGASGRLCDGGDGQKLVTGGNGRLVRQ